MQKEGANTKRGSICNGADPGQPGDRRAERGEIWHHATGTSQSLFPSRSKSESLKLGGQEKSKKTKKRREETRRRKHRYCVEKKGSAGGAKHAPGQQY